jgi:hypothetical protein
MHRYATLNENSIKTSLRDFLFLLPLPEDFGVAVNPRWQTLACDIAEERL